MFPKFRTRGIVQLTQFREMILGIVKIPVVFPVLESQYFFLCLPQDMAIGINILKERPRCIATQHHLASFIVWIDVLSKELMLASQIQPGTTKKKMHSAK